MSKQKKAIYVCRDCGYQTPKWMGRCPDCNQWDSMVEEEPGPGKDINRGLFTMGKAERLDAISLDPEMRLKTGIGEFDRVLGGGVVPGSMVLIGGDPGIGKSTLTIQMLNNLSGQGCKALYLSGEESAQQIKLRAERLSINRQA